MHVPDLNDESEIALNIVRVANYRYNFLLR